MNTVFEVMGRLTAPFGRLPITALFKPIIKNLTGHHASRSTVRLRGGGGGTKCARSIGRRGVQ